MVDIDNEEHASDACLRVRRQMIVTVLSLSRIELGESLSTVAGDFERSSVVMRAALFSFKTIVNDLGADAVNAHCFF